MERLGKSEAKYADMSVIVTAYNRKDFLGFSMKSLLQQKLDGNVIEIIVVSNFDFPIDVTEHNIRIKKIIMEGTIGEFLSEGIRNASSELIAFLDDDDIWKENKIKRIIDVFSDNRIAFYHNLHTYIDFQGNSIRYVRKVEKNNLNSFASSLLFNSSVNIDKLRLATEMRADFNLSCIVIRKRLILKHMDTLNMVPSLPDGFFFWLAVIMKEYLFIDNECLTEYRVHDLNVSGNRDIKNKVTELQKEIRTLDLLIEMLLTEGSNNNYSEEIRNWLELNKMEYRLMMLVFSSQSRIYIIKALLALVTTGLKVRNTLEFRALAFGLIGLISIRLANGLYKKL